jgi:hypothetical protein
VSTVASASPCGAGLGAVSSGIVRVVKSRSGVFGRFRSTVSVRSLGRPVNSMGTKMMASTTRIAAPIMRFFKAGSMSILAGSANYSGASASAGRS